MGRIRLAPINTGLYIAGESTADNVYFYAARAKSDVSICVVGNVAVSANHVPNDSSGIMSDSTSWAELARTIRTNGSVPGIQLSATLPGCIGQRDFVSNDFKSELEQYHELFNQMSPKDWNTLAGLFANAIDLSLRHGFEHIQIHAAHGYAFSLVLDPIINPGQSGLARLTDILDLIASKCSARPSLRISWCTGLSHDPERQTRILEFWNEYRRSIELDLSNGYYNIDKRLIYPDHERGEHHFWGMQLL